MNHDLIKAGFAKAKLTPDRDVYLGGYADIDNEINLCRYPQDILGDVYVRVAVLEQNELRAVFVCLDACVVIEGENIREGVRRDLAQAADTIPERVFLVNTHNHQSLKYFEEPEIDIMLHAVKDAVDHQKECFVLKREFPCDIGVNRRPRYCIAPELPYDNRMVVLSFCEADSHKVHGVLLNYPIHNTALGNGNISNWHYMTSELMGFATEQIDCFLDQNHPGAVTVFMDGFYGASGPQIDGKYSAEHEVIRQTGFALGQNIADYIGAGTPIDLSGHNSLIKECQYGVNPVYGENATEGIVFAGIKFGDLAFFGANCEPYSEIGSALRAYGPFDTLLPLANVNGFVGYIPTAEAFHCGREELECKLNKTPFTDQTHLQFLNDSLACLYELADRKQECVYEATLVSVKADSEKAVYEYTFSPSEAFNQLVLDFGWLSRENCPYDFQVTIPDENGTQQEFSFPHNSVNFLKINLPENIYTRLEITVLSVYRAGRPVDRLDIAAKGMKIASLT